MSIECVELHGRIENCGNIDAVYEKLRQLFCEHLDLDDFLDDVDELFEKENNDLSFDIDDCYGYYGAISEYLEKKALTDFPGIVFDYHVKVYWDNGEIENIRIKSDGKVITTIDEDWESIN